MLSLLGFGMVLTSMYFIMSKRLSPWLPCLAALAASRWL